MKVQVIVLGGGVGGLWVLYELARRNYSCLLIDSHDLGSFASTHNQSWLHTGALYAVTGGEGVDQMLLECQKGYIELQKLCTENGFGQKAIEHNSECLFLFGPEAEIELRNAHSKLVDAGRDPQILRVREFQEIEPILKPKNDNDNTNLQYGMITQDVPFNSHRILYILIQKIFAKQNVSFWRSKTNLTDIGIQHHGDGWTVSIDNSRMAEASILVSASGVLNPLLLKKARGENIEWDDPPIQKSLIAVIHKHICDRIVVIRSRRSGYLNLVPYTDGTTLNMGYEDWPASDATDIEFPHEIHDSLIKKLALILPDFVPGLLNRPPCNTHFYVCQKLNNTIHSRFPRDIYGKRHYFWLDDPHNFYCFYPGKFTLAPVAAQRLTEILFEKLGSPDAQTLSKGNTPSVAKRPYLNTPTHVLQTTQDGKLEFKLISD